VRTANRLLKKTRTEPVPAAPTLEPPPAATGPPAAQPPAADATRDSSPSQEGAARRAARAVRTLPSRIAHDRVLAVLCVILGVGLALRIWLLLVWSPAITGYSDSGIYFQDSVESVWTDPIRTVGYSMFLRVMHGIYAQLGFVITIQHLLGLVTAVLIFLTVRRCGGPRWLGLIPAAVIALSGDQLFIEHSALSDSLFIFLMTLTLYCAVRSLDGGLRWVLLAGLFAGLGVWERGDGLLMAGVVPLWLLFCRGRPTRRALTFALLALAVCLGTVGVYVGWRAAASNMPGLLTSNNAWNLYGRVATWADCRHFTPPSGTGGLCEPQPPSERGYRSSENYIYNPNSPAQILFGPPYKISSYPHAMELLQKWSLAAIEGQPLEYLRAVGLDVVRLFSPNTQSYGDESPDEMVTFMLYGPDLHTGKNEFVEYWQHRLYPSEGAPHRGNIAPLRDWEEITRLDGVLMGVLVALCLGGPWLVPQGRARSGFALFAFTAFAVLLFPIVVKAYDYRFVIPALGPLVAAASLSAWGLALKIRAARAQRRVAAEPA
jgi:hypothetical protein